MWLYGHLADDTQGIPKAWRKQILFTRMKEVISRRVAVGAGHGGGGAAPGGCASSLLLRLFRWSSNLRGRNGIPCWPGVVAVWFWIAASEGDPAW